MSKNLNSLIQGAKTMKYSAQFNQGNGQSILDTLSIQIMINWRARTKKVENNSQSMFRKVNGEIEFANLTGQLYFASNKNLIFIQIFVNKNCLGLKSQQIDCNSKNVCGTNIMFVL